MMFLVKNSFREMKCYLKNYWWFILILFMGFYLFLGLQEVLVAKFILPKNNIILKFSVIFLLWIYAYLGKFPLILMNPANFIYIEMHKNSIQLIVNYILKSILVSCALYTVFKIMLENNLGILFIQSILLIQIAFIIKWRSYHEETIRFYPLAAFALCSIFYFIQTTYSVIIIELFCYLRLLLSLPKLNTAKYFNDLKWIYMNKAAGIRRDYAAAAKLTDEYNSRKNYVFTLKKERLKYPIISKSIYIDTLRASASGWPMKAALVLLIVIIENINYSSYPLAVCSCIIANTLCILLANEYFFYTEQLLNKARNGLFLPISSTTLIICSTIMPNIFISLIYLFYGFLAECSITRLLILVSINILINFLQFSMVFIEQSKRKLPILLLAMLRVGISFYCLF